MNFDDVETQLSYGNNQEPTTVEKHDELVKHRIFLNHIDQYNARHISEYLTDQNMGAMKSGGMEMGGEDEEEQDLPPVHVGEKYECVGTTKSPLGRQTEDISYIVNDNDTMTIEREILCSGFVIYDITNDPREIPKALNALNTIVNQIESVKEIGPKTFKRYDQEYLFILISNVLTWGKTKPINKSDPEVPFTEADYKKRKALPNYAEQIACEREVVAKGKKYKDILRTYVLCCGIPYGFEEDNLFLLFKMAWENKDLPIFLPGNNCIPLIHIQDIAKVIHAILELLPKKQYILVVEQIPSRLARIMRALASIMGRGVKEMTKEQAFLSNSTTQKLYDILTLNLKIEPAYILDELGLEFRSDLNLVQNMNKIVMEFRAARNLIPLKVFVHGPIASGRSTLTENIVEYYGLHYINVKTMIDETREHLAYQIDTEIEARKAKTDRVQTDEDVEDEGGEEVEEDYEPPVDLEGLQDQLRTLETALEQNDGILSEEYVIRLMRQFLASNTCQNQGYVLDAYPKTMYQCKEIFGPELDGLGGGGEGGDDDEVRSGRSIVPQFIISLEANDDYLLDVMMNYEEQGKLFEEESMLKRLKFFRENNTEDNTLLNFFDEHEIHPININMMQLQEFTTLYKRIHEIMGHPVGFEPSADEQAELLRCQQEADKLKAEQEALDKELLERQALEDYQEKMEDRIRVLDELQKEEEKLLTVQCEPLRRYLMMHVFPTLTSGLLEIARIKPNDPVDYLAEYLFKFNPEGKMFDPTYTRRGEIIEKDTDVFLNKTSTKRLQESCPD